MQGFFGVICVFTAILIQSATACEILVPQFHYRYDAGSHKTYASNDYSELEIPLKSDYKEIVQPQGEGRVLRFASDGVHAYFFEKPIIGAKDYATLTPIQNDTLAESRRYGWRYYEDRTAFYAAEDTGSQVLLHRLAERKSDAYRFELLSERRLAQGILVVGDSAYAEQQKLPFKGRLFKTQRVQDDFYVVSDGHATYSPVPLAHNDVDEWQTWYGELGWVKLANIAPLKIIGSIENARRECGATQYLYDVIYEVRGLLAVNQGVTNIPSSPVRSVVSGSSLSPSDPSAERDALVKAFTPYLFRYRLIPTLMAGKADIPVRLDAPSSLYSERYQLFLGGHEYALARY